MNAPRPRTLTDSLEALVCKQITNTLVLQLHYLSDILRGEEVCEGLQVSLCFSRRGYMLSKALG